MRGPPDQARMPEIPKVIADRFYLRVTSGFARRMRCKAGRAVGAVANALDNWGVHGFRACRTNPTPEGDAHG